MRPSFAPTLLLPIAALLPLLSLGCGGSAFETGHPAADAALLDSGGTQDSGLLDSPPGDSTASDSSPSPDGPSPPVEAGTCAPLTAADTTIYVDSRFTGTPATGSQACPLHTIQQGLAAAKTLGGPRTVHVAGATPALVYDETGPVTVGPGITLSGSGALTTTISASGPCMTGTCAVLVQPGGIVDGFAITSPSGDGLWTLSGSPTPLIRNVAADRSTGNGIVALGSVTLGPNIGASNNGNAGVESPSGSTGTVHVVAGINGFNSNKGNGIDLSGGAALSFEGGTVNGQFQGIRIASNPPTSHTITGLTAAKNTGPGAVVVYGGQTLKLRSSTLVGNTSTGLLYDYVNGSTLDLGTVNEPGNNTFGGMTSTDRNGVSGITLCGVPASQRADGDSWVTCPPTQTVVVCGTTITNVYTDVAYQSAVASMNPITGSCSVGP